MFTGIIEEVGTVSSVTGSAASSLLTIRCNDILRDVKEGDSMAVSGVCLTVTSRTAFEFTADVMHETLNRSSLGSLKSGDKVNLERALEMGGRFGGHIVSGHIDGTGKILRMKEDDIAVWYTISASPQIMRYIIEKGSVAVDGISLTVADVDEDSFQVSVIPHTSKMTTLSLRRPGDTVNLENDCIGKYVEKLLTPYKPAKSGGGGTSDRRPGTAFSGGSSGSGITMDFLMKNGF